MRTKLIIWGKCKEELSTGLIAYSKCIKRGYQFIEGQLLAYSQVQGYAELEAMLSKEESPVLCTDQLKDYAYLKELLKEKTSYSLIFIPHLEHIEIKKLCKQFVFVEEQILRKDSSKKQLTILWGKGQNEGEILLDILKHFYLIQYGRRYYFLCYLPDGINETGLAEMEDVLREYINEGGSIYLTALKQTEFMEQEEAFFCLLCSE